MQRFLLIIIIVFGLYITAQSQFIRADYKKAELIYHRPVLVQLMDTAEADNIEAVRRADWYNKTIQELMPEYWKLNDSIIFKDQKYIKSVMGSKSPDYAVFMGIPSLEGQQSSNDIFWYRSFTFMLFLSEDGKHLNTSSVDRSSSLITSGESGGQLLRGRYIFKLSFAGFQLSKEDLIFAIQTFNEKVSLALKEKKSKKGLYAAKVPRAITSSLKTKTLLIPEDLDPEGVTDEGVKKYYHHPFHIAKQEEIDEAIQSKKENTAYIHYLWSDHERMFLGTLIDAGTGEILATLSPNSIKLEDDLELEAGISYRYLIRMNLKKLKAVNKSIK